jgi:hypothetical protein
MSGERPADPYTHWRRRAEAAEAEVERLNMEMLVYREKLTPADADAMAAVIKALYEAKNKPAHVNLAESYTMGSHSVETIPTASDASDVK